MPSYSPRQEDEEPSCITPSSSSDRQGLAETLNEALNSGGEGYVLRLCAGQQYYINAPIVFTSPDQEISTEGYPTGDQRATIVINGTDSHGVAIQGNCDACSGIKLRNIQINGSRNASTSALSGSNIEIGGNTSNQLVEYVSSYNTRGWTCLHVSEGSLRDCRNATIQNNDIGPCGFPDDERWADGISLSCRNSFVRSNLVNDATDGGITIIGAPGTHVLNNTIQANRYILRAGVKMISYLPYSGDYSGTVVYENTIIGGFSDEEQSGGAETGTNRQQVIIKLGIAIGPRIWDGSRFSSTTQVSSGIVRDNDFTGAFAYALAIASAENFTISDNEMTGNYAFIGERNSSCTEGVPSPAAFLVDTGSTAIIEDDEQEGIEEFQLQGGDDLVNCITPPAAAQAVWPFPSSTASTTEFPSLPTAETSLPVHVRTTSEKIGMGVGIPLAIIVFFIAVWFIRRWAVRHQIARRISQRLSQFSNRLSSLLS